MAKGDEKRTYKITEESVDVIDWMEDNTILDKSDFVDRAVKYYWLQHKNGNLNDPILTDDASDIQGVPDLDSSSDEGSSILERLRGKK